ncbi:hypothetical protein U1Q18_028438 [Sarracenia purpurea var. burkii]
MAPRRLASRGAAAIANFDNTRFQLQAAKERYNELFTNRGVLIEQNVNLLDYAGTPIPRWFERLGWTPFLAASEDKKQKFSEIKAGLDDADVLIRKMDLEARSLQPSLKAVLLAKLREYKADLNKLKQDVKKISSANANQVSREELLESGMSDVQAVCLAPYPL